VGFCASALDACGAPDDCGALDACDEPDDCDCGACEFACDLAAGELPACGAPDVCGVPDGCCALGACDALVGCELVAGEPGAAGVDSLCVFDASDVDAPGCTVGCSGPLGCGIAGPLLSADSDRECDSSAKLIVYDLNGGSSDEFGAALAGTGAEGPFGPDNSSGTNNTIRTTRMIAPVSRSFTRSSTVGTKPPQSSEWRPRRPITIGLTGH
jgi:hypothetical protein